MADYIYLIQNRLTPAQWRALEAVREAARAQSMPVFLVGGAVRDLTTGSPVRDLDFAVQGDARTLVPELEGGGATVAGENAAFGSVFLTFRGGVRAEVGPTLSVTYPKPGQPETQSAPILDDLRRRDFTANAMAVSLNEGSYGLLLDPLNGTADIENRELRLVSAYGFIEQPALLLRAARLGERLGWSLEERTQSRYQNSKEEGHIGALPDADRGYELEEVFHEEDPLSILEHMTSEGWRDALFPGLRSNDGDRAGLDEVRDLVSQLEGQGLHPDPSAVFFPLVTAKMSEENRAALKARFARQGFVRQIESLEARSKELAGQLTSKAAAQPSETWRIITSADPEVILYLAYHSRSSAVQSKLKAFLKDWPQMRQKIPYAQMQEMRITPDLPGYDKLLDDLFFALIDGKLDTPEATRAFLEPFSPPAPPQVAVRRRPAKSARGRAKRVVEELPTESPEVADDADAAETPDTDDRDPEEADEAEGDESEAEPEPPVKRVAAQESKAPEVRKPAKPAEKGAATKQVAPPAAPVKSVPAPAKAAAAPAKTAAKSAPEKTVAPAPLVVKQASAPAKGKAAVASPAAKAPAKAVVAKKTALAKKSAPAKPPVKLAPPAKKAAAKQPVKLAAKKPAPVKQPSKASAQKLPAKASAQKLPAKKQAVKTHSASAKGSVSVKAAKKAAAKGRKGR